MVAKSHVAVEADLHSATDPLLGGLAYQKEAAPCPAPPPDRTTTIRREVRRRVTPAGARPRRPATRRPVTARRRRTPALPVLPPPWGSPTRYEQSWRSTPASRAG